jgi:uncharacterized protein
MLIMKRKSNVMGKKEIIQISKPDLFMLVGIKNDLEERLQRQVDIVTYRENMNQFLKARIDKEAVYA